MGHLSSYGDIANNINSPMASRAVGTAIGSNPIAFLIPCHRVIQASGLLVVTGGEVVGNLPLLDGRRLQHANMLVIE